MRHGGRSPNDITPTAAATRRSFVAGWPPGSNSGATQRHGSGRGGAVAPPDHASSRQKPVRPYHSVASAAALKGRLGPWRTSCVCSCRVGFPATSTCPSMRSQSWRPSWPVASTVSPRTSAPGGVGSWVEATSTRRATVTRARDEARIELTVDAWWGTPLADLVVRVRREVSEGLNASLGTNWDPETIVVQLGSLPVRTDPLEGTP